MVKIKQATKVKTGASGLFAKDLVWLFLGLLVGFVAPFIIWLTLVTYLSDIFLSRS